MNDKDRLKTIKQKHEQAKMSLDMMFDEKDITEDMKNGISDTKFLINQAEKVQELTRIIARNLVA